MAFGRSARIITIYIDINRSESPELPQAAIVSTEAARYIEVSLQSFMPVYHTTRSNVRILESVWICRLVAIDCKVIMTRPALERDK